jgi:hypothetical protein
VTGPAKFRSWVVAGPAFAERLATAIVEGRNDDALEILHAVGGPAPALAKVLAERAAEARRAA